MLLCLLAATTATYSEETMDERCRKEVIELHQFFQDWSNGKLEESDASFERFSGVMAESFEIISPDGGRMKRAEILGRVRGGHGAGQGSRIWIENYASRPLTDGFLLVTYEEWQEEGGEKRGRVSTALFRERSHTPNGVVWLHVHETWLSN
jgi:hypothetical protein